MLSSCLPTPRTPLLCTLRREAALSAYYKLRTTKKTKQKTRSGPKSSGSSSATAAANRASAVGAVSSSRRPFAYTTHTAV